MHFHVLQDLENRDLLYQLAGGEAASSWLESSGRVLYCGFDPTADSLHIGSLMPLLTLRRFQLAGHCPIALVGGATGLIGDPSFKSEERSLNSYDVVEQWTAKIELQMRRFLDFDEGTCSANVVNNLDWTRDRDVLTFLRDVGKHFSVNSMIQKESVRQRITREGDGISFTEFSYMILQSYDFVMLNKLYNCGLQIGGSDQWGNITAGIDLTRRMNQATVFGLTQPLITKSDGSKFGKTESGTVWLDSERTSPYAFYQFWLNTADADVYKFLRYFTFLSLEQISSIQSEDARAEGRLAAQSVLATEVTRLVHGEEGLAAAKRITEALFSDSSESLSEQDFAQLRQDGLPTSNFDRAALPDSLTQLLGDCGIASSGKQVKDALQRKAVFINGEPIGLDSNTELTKCFDPARAVFGCFFLVRLGRKKYHLFEIR